MKYCKFLLIMLVSSMLCFSVIAVPGNQKPSFSGQKFKVNDNVIIYNPLISNGFEGAFKTIINHFIIIIPLFLIKMIQSIRCENLETVNNCAETDIDSDFEEDISEGKIDSVTLNDDKEEKIEDNDTVEEIIIGEETKENANDPIQDEVNNEGEDDDNEQDATEENGDDEEQDENLDNDDGETEDPIDEFNLEFTLELDEVYMHQEPITVTAIIENIGEKAVQLCEMDVKLRSLDFEIQTPVGNFIHYIGPFEGKGEAVMLDPFQSISYKINLTSTNVTFGEKNNGPMGMFGSYNFPPGSYTIKGIYISYQTLTAESSSYFQGVLYSPSYNFVIREGVTPN
jgi:hypothetical protein